MQAIQHRTTEERLPGQPGGPSDAARAVTRLVVVQPSSFCNIDCRYCYVPGRTDRSVIEPEVLEHILTKVFQSPTVADGFRLVWHNGEPLSLGRGFYEKALATIRRVNTSGKSFLNCIQTNATLIDQGWVDFFLEHNVSPSVSIDGPKHLHNINRKTRSGEGTFDAVMRGVRYLRDNDIPLVGLCVVSADLLDHGTELAEFFLKEGFTSLGLIIEEPWGGNSSTSFTQLTVRATEKELEGRYKRFISDLFDAWLPHKDRLAIREFSDMFSAFKRVKLDKTAHVQTEDSSPCRVLSFSRDGDVTTFSPQMVAGTAADPKRFAVANIRDIQSLSEIEALERHQGLAAAVAQGKRRCERECGYFPICGGGAPASKFYQHGTFDCTETRECRYAKQLLADLLLSKVAQAVV